MVQIKIIAKDDIYGGLGHKIFAKNKEYLASNIDSDIYEDGERGWWSINSDIIVTEYPVYDWSFIEDNFNLLEDIRDEKINNILK